MQLLSSRSEQPQGRRRRQQLTGYQQPAHQLQRRLQQQVPTRDQRANPREKQLQAEPQAYCERISPPAEPSGVSIQPQSHLSDGETSLLLLLLLLRLGLRQSSQILRKRQQKLSLALHLKLQRAVLLPPLPLPCEGERRLGRLGLAYWRFGCSN